MALSDYELLLPFAEWKSRPCEKKIRAAKGLEKRVLQMQERGMVHSLGKGLLSFCRRRSTFGSIVGANRRSLYRQGFER
jgi:hypothetical protein